MSLMNHRYRNAIALIVGLLCLGCTLGGAARAGVDIDLRASVPIGDDAQLFFGINSQYYDRDRPDVERWGGECRNPDDLAVLLFLARQTGRPPAQLIAMRRDGLTWWQIGLRLDMPMDVWFVAMSRDPGPPYGRAYGHWRRHQRDARHAFALSDREARDLVAVRMLHEYYRVDVPLAMKWRASGRDLRTLAIREYRQRHPHDERDGRSERRRHDRRHHNDDTRDRRDNDRGHGRDNSRR
jgi:hypothetical protein